MSTKTQTKTTTPAALWISEDGRITCVEHGGNALAAAVEARPERLFHITDLDHWQAVTPLHIEGWAVMVGDAAAAESAKCETCGMGPRGREDQPMSTEPPAVAAVVYSRPNCTACTSTVRALDKRGVSYEVREMTEEEADRFKAEGHMQAPVVVTEAETWAGFRPDKIMGIPVP